VSLFLKNVPNLGIAPSSSEIILKPLRDAIIKGELPEDEPIRQDELAKSFNVSKIPVREALKRLESEGLVEFHRNRDGDRRRLQRRLVAGQRQAGDPGHGRLAGVCRAAVPQHH